MRRLTSRMIPKAAALVVAAILTGCSAQPVKHDGSVDGDLPVSGKSAAASKPSAPKDPAPLARPYTTPADPYPSTYKPPQGAPTLIKGGTVLTGTGTRLDNADVLIVDGRISA